MTLVKQDSAGLLKSLSLAWLVHLCLHMMGCCKLLAFLALERIRSRAIWQSNEREERRGEDVSEKDWSSTVVPSGTEVKTHCQSISLTLLALSLSLSPLSFLSFCLTPSLYPHTGRFQWSPSTTSMTWRGGTHLLPLLGSQCYKVLPALKRGTLTQCSPCTATSHYTADVPTLDTCVP